MIIIHALFKVKPEQREGFLVETKPLIAGSKGEEGNISYNLFEDVSNPNTFIVVEEWKNEEAVKIHNQEPHFRAFGEKSGEFLLEPMKVTTYRGEEVK
ncbi:antibiotic biosynthesis monooxygenase [Terrilactibacillus sp. BCM23-1]|uniref:Antibiotic biosynthesis monooxygenase n=1 Tax=Terrilactibacillus tamarindi TaxID=2599694 RepID=A0A6N8CS65_9BACI|nr:putative quinol monooxygenase [Terrilactibacillus tamarindi]MTT31903.1 antibiotic biosynthesis monooxygenase [Terrilactibacillus tamarindi]